MWYPFDNGSTLGQKGSEDGETIRDEEHPLGSRITLERDTTAAPFAITCGIYGWMFHTRFFSTEDEATSQYVKMKDSLSELLAPLEDPNFDDSRVIEKAIEAFVETYP